jgi:hypothetical protein
MAFIGIIGAAVAGAVGVSVAAASIAAGIIGGMVVGAVVGAVYSAVTGGNILKGMLYGAIGGAVLGGVGAAIAGAGSISTAATAPTAAGWTPAGMVAPATSSQLAGQGVIGVNAYAGSGVAASGAAGGAGSAGGAASWLSGISEGMKAIGPLATVAGESIKGGAMTAAADDKNEFDAIEGEKNRQLRLEEARMSSETSRYGVDKTFQSASDQLQAKKDEFKTTFDESKRQFDTTRQDVIDNTSKLSQGIQDVQLETKQVNLLELQRQRKSLVTPSWLTLNKTVGAVNG